MAGKNTPTNRSTPYTEEELEEMRQVFESMESYKDGKIRAVDHSSFLTKANYPHTKEQLAQYLQLLHGMSGDDWIEWAQLVKFMRAQHDPTLLMREYALEFDRDRDGYISLEEFQLGMETVRTHDPVQFEAKGAVDYEEFVKEADTNQDGKVSVEELVAWLTK